jgi:hypothetical protein
MLIPTWREHCVICGAVHYLVWASQISRIFLLWCGAVAPIGLSPRGPFGKNNVPIPILKTIFTMTAFAEGLFWVDQTSALFLP